MPRSFVRNVVLCCLLTIGSAAAQEETPNTLTAEEKAAGWKLLFDGQTTSGWRSYKKDKINAGWKVVDGTLSKPEKGAGDIVTVDQFGAFELSLDYRIAKAGNSGLISSSDRFRQTELRLLRARPSWFSSPARTAR